MLSLTPCASASKACNTGQGKGRGKRKGMVVGCVGGAMDEGGGRGAAAGECMCVGGGGWQQMLRVGGPWHGGKERREGKERGEGGKGKRENEEKGKREGAKGRKVQRACLAFTFACRLVLECWKAAWCLQS
eukprot:115858-Chlamydomonas_euryale.AAC.2